MDKKTHAFNKYTHEDLIGKFDSSFELVNYAIHRVRNYISTGRSPLVDTTVKNPAFVVLKEMLFGKDKLDSIEETQENISE